MEPQPNARAELRAKPLLLLLLVALAALVSLPVTLMFAFASPMLLDAPRFTGAPGLLISLFAVLTTPVLAMAMLFCGLRALLRYSRRRLFRALGIAALWLASLPFLIWVVA